MLCVLLFALSVSAFPANSEDRDERTQLLKMLAKRYQFEAEDRPRLMRRRVPYALRSAPGMSRKRPSFQPSAW